MQVCTGLTGQCALLQLSYTHCALIKTYNFFFTLEISHIIVEKLLYTNLSSQYFLQGKRGVCLYPRPQGYATVCAHSTFRFVWFIFLYLKHKQHTHVYKHVRVYRVKCTIELFFFFRRIDRKAIKVKSSEKQQRPGLFGTLQSLLVNFYVYIYVSDVCVWFNGRLAYWQKFKSISRV